MYRGIINRNVVNYQYIAKLLCRVAKSHECLTNVTCGGSHPSIAGTVSVVISSVAAWLDLTVCKPPQDPLWVILFTALIKKAWGSSDFRFL